MASMHEVDPETYAAVSGLAVAALVFGILSVAALVDPLAWGIPAVGAVLGAVALARIVRRPGELVGRKAAVAGLLLSLFFGSVAVGERNVYRALLRREARQVARAWFERVAERQPQLAHQLSLDPDHRQPPGSDAWVAYRKNGDLHNSLEKYVGEPLMRTLLALGEKATVRYYGSPAIEGNRGQESVVLLYAVTFDAEHGKKTFFVQVVARHTSADIEGRIPWAVVNAGGVERSKTSLGREEGAADGAPKPAEPPIQAEPTEKKSPVRPEKPTETGK
jgi:hypothetical protein